MVFDGQRNSAYARALTKLVGPGTTVMDLGAGLGVHGLNAAHMGARSVHLVEPAPVLSLAQTAARDNNLENVHCHNCTVQDLQLDARVDVIISVFTGNFLLSEDLLPSLFFARDNFLAPGGRMLPDRGRMEVVPVSAPDYYQRQVERWDTYPEHALSHGLPALDYSAVRRFAANTLYYDRRDGFGATALGEPASLMELDFTVASSAACDSRVRVEIEREGICHGWLGWFQIRLMDEWFSTSGEELASHWRPVFLPLERPVSVGVGEQLDFALKRPEFGEWTWTTRHGANSQRQSTFLSRPVSAQCLYKSSDLYQPGLGERGQAAHWLLPKMSGEVPVSQLATELSKAFPAIFQNHGEALEFVKDLAWRFS
jgi:hypothetical protein